MKIKRAMVLAAGKGTRLGELTKNIPKPLIDLGGVTPLFRALKGLENAGIEEVVVNCHYLAEKIVSKLEYWQKEGLLTIKIIISHELEELETGGGIKNALPHFKDEPFVVVNADIVWGEGFSDFVLELINNYNFNEMDFLLGLTPRTFNDKNKGDFSINQKSQIKFLNKNETSNNYYCGLAVTRPQAFNKCKKGFVPLKKIWLEAILNNSFYGYKANYSWFDMGTLEGLNKAKSIVSKNNLN